MVHINKYKGYTYSPAFKGRIKTGFSHPVCFPDPPSDEVTVDGTFEGPFGNRKHYLHGRRERIGTLEPDNPEQPRIKGMTAFKKCSNSFMAA